MGGLLARRRSSCLTYGHIVGKVCRTLRPSQLCHLRRCVCRDGIDHRCIGGSLMKDCCDLDLWRLTGRACICAGHGKICT